MDITKTPTMLGSSSSYKEHFLKASAKSNDSVKNFIMPIWFCDAQERIISLINYSVREQQ